jgi:hypothetical protein
LFGLADFVVFLLFFLRELLFLDWDIGLLATSRDPNSAAGIYFGLDCGLLVFFKYSAHKP